MRFSYDRDGLPELARQCREQRLLTWQTEARLKQYDRQRLAWLAAYKIDPQHIKDESCKLGRNARGGARPHGKRRQTACGIDRQTD